MRPRKGPDKAKSEQELLADALKEVELQQASRQHRKVRRKGIQWLRELPGWVKIPAVLLLLLIADGIRRENKEFRATLLEFSGEVAVVKYPQQHPTPARRKMALRDKDVVTTLANSTATVVSPDGSSIKLDPNTKFEVRMLDFARGGRRERSFMVHLGAATMRLSKFFGDRSQATVCTPMAVAAVRGTAFYVTYDPGARQSYVQVAEGSVRLRTPAGEIRTQAGQMVAASGYQLRAAEGMPAQNRSALSAEVGDLVKYERSPSFLQRIEWAITNALDPLLQLIGLAPGGWGYSSIDFARRTTCQSSLKSLRVHLESLQGEEVPIYVNLVTLDELQINPKERDRILSTFAGGMLESYRNYGRGNYELYARARDKSRTLYKMTAAELIEVK